MDTPPGSTSSIKMLNHFATGVRRYFLFAILASGGSIFFNFMIPQIIRVSVDYVVGSEQVDALSGMVRVIMDALGGRPFLRTHFFLCAIGIAICAAFTGAFGFVSRVSIAKASGGFTKKLRDTLFTHIQYLPYQWHTDNQTGDIIQRCTFDVETVQGFVSMQMIEVLRTAILLVTALVMMFSMNVTLAFVSLAFIPIITLYSLLFYRKISAQFRLADEAEGELMTDVQENLTAVRVVRAFGRERFEKDQFEGKLNLFTNKWIDLGYTLGVYWGVGDLATASQILAIVCTGAWLAATQRATLGELLAFISYTNMISWPVRSLGRTLSELSKAGVSISRLREILDAPVEQDPPDAAKPELYDDIHFDHVSFGYGENQILKDISFAIPKGTTFGILGATGSGKSTIAYLLNRLYDLPESGGAIRIGETDIRAMDRAHLRKGVGLVLQEPFLFSKTVKRNIAIAAKDADLEEIRKSAQVAAVDANILEFKDGYDTMVGERGVTLSGGQKQRIAIARTLMLDCPIMVFDDSTSSVDMETDEKIRLALQENTSGRTVIFISHRISTLMNADQILVLEDGGVAQLGSHAELAAQEGVYRRVYQMQSDAKLYVSEEMLRDGGLESGDGSGSASGSESGAGMDGPVTSEREGGIV
ncbi:MAG: ABC transporter ATP-binding protein/permease [Clostridiales bacterium]|nr:ABC transporter ATP-binding protein/permease [Clostridiales bacterium]